MRCDGPRVGDKCGARPSHVKLAEVRVYGKSIQTKRAVTVLGG